MTDVREITSRSWICARLQINASGRAVGEELLVWIAREILERQHGQRADARRVRRGRSRPPERRGTERDDHERGGAIATPRRECVAAGVLVSPVVRVACCGDRPTTSRIDW
mgnify:CR=1 FL=1